MAEGRKRFEAGLQVWFRSCLVRVVIEVVGGHCGEMRGKRTCLRASRRSYSVERLVNVFRLSSGAGGGCFAVCLRCSDNGSAGRGCARGRNVSGSRREILRLWRGWQTNEGRK